MAGMVAGMEGDKVTKMVAGMEVDKVADMEVDKMTDMEGLKDKVKQARGARRSVQVQF